MTENHALNDLALMLDSDSRAIVGVRYLLTTDTTLQGVFGDSRALTAKLTRFYGRNLRSQERKRLNWLITRDLPLLVQERHALSMSERHERNEAYKARKKANLITQLRSKTYKDQDIRGSRAIKNAV